MSTEKITIDQEAAQQIREALIIGLRCYGEVERIRGFAEVFKGAGGNLPAEAIPAFCETSSAPCLFADAFAYLNL
ncbi:MAG: hypothetical protein ABTQ26_11880 [Azonexus sp.]